MPQYYLGLDQGTTGSTAILFDTEFRQIARGYTELIQHYPAPGMVEHDPKQIYDSLCSATAEALRVAGATAADIRAIGIDNQGETVVAWDRQTGEPVYPAIVWQDRRTAEQVEGIRDAHGDEVERLSGLAPDAYFGATKLAWILQNVPEAQKLHREHRLLAGPTDSYMMWRLTGGRSFFTDVVTASRTNLMNIETLEWDTTLLSIFGIPADILPPIRNSADNFGITDGDAFLGITAPISGNTVDQQAALLGQGCFTPGSLKTTYGTGCFMLMNTGDKLCRNDRGLLPTPAWALNGKATFAVDGGAYITGAAVQWLRDGLGIIGEPADAGRMAESLPDNGGVYFVPAFAGLRAPTNDPYARGTVVGLTGGATAAHIARATLEAEAFQVYDLFDALRAVSDTHVTAMRADGGSTKSRFLMQFQADILNIPIELPEITETTALGSAYLAAIGVGDLASPEQAAAFWRKKQEFVPTMSEDEREELLYGWHRAVERSNGWIDPKHK